MPSPLALPLLAFARRLRFPWLFAITATLLVIDLLVPDPLPLIDEIAFGLLTVLFAQWRQRKPPPKPDAGR